MNGGLPSHISDHHLRMLACPCTRPRPRPPPVLCALFAGAPLLPLLPLLYCAVATVARTRIGTRTSGQARMVLCPRHYPPPHARARDHITQTHTHTTAFSSFPWLLST